MVSVVVSNTNTRKNIGVVNEETTTVNACFEIAGLSIGNATVNVNGTPVRADQLDRSLADICPDATEYRVSAIIKSDCAC